MPTLQAQILAIVGMTTFLACATPATENRYAVFGDIAGVATTSTLRQTGSAGVMTRSTFSRRSFDRFMLRIQKTDKSKIESDLPEDFGRSVLSTDAGTVLGAVEYERYFEGRVGLGAVGSVGGTTWARKDTPDFSHEALFWKAVLDFRYLAVYEPWYDRNELIAILRVGVAAFGLGGQAKDYLQEYLSTSDRGFYGAVGGARIELNRLYIDATVSALSGSAPGLSDVQFVVAFGANDSIDFKKESE